MELQKKISLKINKNYTEKNIQCIIEEIHSNNIVVARSYKDAPEVDGLVYIKTKKFLTPGDIVNVKITDATCYDLYGVI